MKRILITLILIGLLTACTTAEESLSATDIPADIEQEELTEEPTEEPVELRHIRLPMGYIPNVQYAPFYAAIDQGYYAEEGLELEMDYSSETDGIALVGSGELEFSIASGEQVLLARDKDIPVVYVMSWYQQYPLAVISQAELGIEQPEDLEGHAISLPGLYGANYIALKALLNYAGISEQDVTIESIGYTQVESFSSGQTDITVGYLANEPVQLRALGEDIDVLLIDDFVDLASNGIVANETLMQEEPELVRAMLRATLKGIQFVIDHPDQAYEICEKYVENLADADQEVQKQVLAVSTEFYGEQAEGLTYEEAWKNMYDVLVSMDLIGEDVIYQDAFNNEFLP